MQSIQIVQLVFQVAFWGVISTVALLTYLRARRTILQPIRTEVFKAQLQEMSNILKIFIGKGEIELREAFHFDKLFYVNACAMYDSYAATFFDLKQNFDERPYNTKECPLSIFRSDYAKKVFTIMNEHTRESKEVQPKLESPDPRVRAAIWNDYTHGELHIPRETFDMMNHFSSILENPLLPSQCVALLEEYLQAVLENRDMILSLLTDAAKQMVEKYPSLESLERSSYNWIYKMYVDKFTHLKPKADEIISYVRSYYRVDDIMKV